MGYFSYEWYDAKAFYEKLRGTTPCRPFCKAVKDLLKNDSAVDYKVDYASSARGAAEHTFSTLVDGVKVVLKYVADYRCTPKCHFTVRLSINDVNVKLSAKEDWKLQRAMEAAIRRQELRALKIVEESEANVIKLLESAVAAQPQKVVVIDMGSEEPTT